MLKGEAGGYGFEPITEAAIVLESALLKKIALSELREPLDDLLNWCMLARSTAPQSAKVE